MLTMQKILDQFTGMEVLESIISAMEKNFQDFPPIRQKYIRAMDTLKHVLGENAVQNEKDAICQQIASSIFFSGALGIQANYRYFSDPVGGNFLNVDPEVYLRENIARHLPQYTAAQQSRDEFYSALDEEQKKIYQPVIEYTCYLEAVGPKLAHHYGYLLGNELLQWVVPGYHPDTAFTLQYGIKMETYLGKQYNKLINSSVSLR